MAIRKYRFNVTSYPDLVQFCPKAVECEVIPEHTEYSPVYSVIAKLLDAGLTVPGIELASEMDAHDANAAEMGLGERKEPVKHELAGAVPERDGLESAEAIAAIKAKAKEGVEAMTKNRHKVGTA